MPESDQPIDWEMLFRQHIPDVLKLATRLTGNLHDAEDVAQEALLRAARSRSTFRGDSTFRTWLNRIVVNVFRTWMRNRRTAGPLEEETIDPLKNTDAEQAETAELVAQHVSNLPERQREVLVLCIYENMSAAEVAEALGLTVQNVYSTLNVARNRLKQSLASQLSRESLN
ncbi:MAG: RNA polymerase sigma factor [Planctomycetaceae bacterium]